MEHNPILSILWSWMMDIDGFWFDVALFIYLLFKSCDQAVKDDVGTIRIQRPHKGPFYVSPRAIDQLIANLGKWARLCLCVYIPAYFF